MNISTAFSKHGLFSTVLISRNHVQLARFLLPIQRFDKTKRKYISHAIKKTICETFKKHALKTTVTHTVLSEQCEIRRKRREGRLTWRRNKDGVLKTPNSDET